MKKSAVSLTIVALLVALTTTTALAYPIQPRLLAGQSGFAGVVRITGDANFLTVTFMLRSGQGWCLEESAVHVGLSLDDFPQNKGGAIPGKFDYKADHDCARGYTYVIPVDPAWYGNQLYIAAHAVVIAPDGTRETGWAVNCGNLEGGQFPGRNWSAYIIFPANAWD
jgi:hypothetical protein